ncbi:MAG: hypothetical protein VYE22_29320 [Myxococcota bacterium]|nr:hypothetical protein [Myxococcota bacterium]
MQPRIGELLATRDALYSCSMITNTALGGAPVRDWPDAEQVRRLEASAARRGALREGAEVYGQLAFPVESMPSDPPAHVTQLGYDVVDGAESFLVDYGGLPSIELELNRYGLLDERSSAEALVDALAEQWGMSREDAQVWVIFRIER